MATLPLDAPHSGLPAFADGRRVRLALGTLLYLAQGFPQGVVFYAIPTWLGANGQSAAVVGAAASAASMPWMVKWAVGAIMDRYTWLPMGRRRPWLIGAQTLIALAFLAYALIAPSPTDTTLVIGFTFLISSLTAIQDVALDALVIDLTPEDEMGRLNGFMFAGKLLGIAGGMAVAGYFMQYYSITAAMLAMLTLFGIPALAAVLVRERRGEKRLPWTRGETDPEAAAINPEAFMPIFRIALRTLFRRDTLLVIGMLITYGIYQTLSDQGSNLFYARQFGWGEGQIGGINAVGNLVGAAMCLTVGGWLIDRIGPRRGAFVGGLGSGLLYGTLALSLGSWRDPIAAVVLLQTASLFGTLFYLSFLVMAMRVSAPEAAATSFALIVATHSLGTTTGGWALGEAEAAGGFGAVFGLAASLVLLSMLIAQFTSAKAGGRAAKDADANKPFDIPATAH